MSYLGHVFKPFIATDYGVLEVISAKWVKYVIVRSVTIVCLTRVWQLLFPFL